MAKKIFLIAGEASGDSLGGRLMQALLAQHGDVEFSGVGGDMMTAQGLKSLLPMNELCVMGIWEVLGELPRLCRLIKAVVEDIEAFQPDIVVTIDLPDFNFQVAKRLKQRCKTKARIIHYVAPTVWAWRPGRAKKIARFLDGLMCLFPFEPPYFKKHGLKAVFVGHPMVESRLAIGDGSAFRAQHGIPMEAPVLGLFLGSRPREVKTMSRIIMDVAAVFQEQYPNVQLVLPTLPHLQFEVMQLATALGFPAYVIVDPAHKPDAIKACDIALAVSGTVGLELAYAGVPHVIAYKTHPLTWLMLRRLVKVKYAHLANILLDAPVIPEFLQSRCNPVEISKEVLRLQRMPVRRQEQIAAMEKVRTLLQPPGGMTPSERAAAVVSSVLK